MAKIGFHFVMSLPSDIDPREEKSFYFIKKEIPRINWNGDTVVDVFAEHYIGIRDEEGRSNFHQLTPPVNFYANIINGVNLLTNYELHPNMGVNLTLNDICSYQPDNFVTSTPLVFNNNIYLGKKFNTLFLSDVKNKPVNINESNITNFYFGLNIGSNNETYNHNNNFFVGNNITFINNEIDNNIIIGNNIELSKEGDNDNKIINGNTFIGGKYYFTDNDIYNGENKIEGNIYVKNLGFGNLISNFQFALPIKLSDNTKLANIDDNSINDYQRVAIVDNNGNIAIAEKSEFFTTPTLQQVVAKGNTSTNPIIIQNYKFGANTITNSLTISNINYTQINGHSLLIGHNNLSLNPEIWFSVITGYDNLNNSSSSLNNIIYGGGNLKYGPASYNTIVGFNNLINSGNTTLMTQNNVFGQDNGQEWFLGNENNLFGTGNLKRNNGNKNIVIGNNNGNIGSNTNYNETIIIGNDLRLNPNEDFIIGKVVSGEQINFVSGDFNTSKFILGGYLYFDFSYIPNSIANIQFNKIITATADGRIGYEQKDYQTRNAVTGFLHYFENRTNQWVSTNVKIEELTYKTTIITTGSNNFSILTLGSNNMSQHGRKTIIDNDSNNILLTTDILADPDFISTYIKMGTGTVTFEEGPGTTIHRIGGLYILNGEKGSTAELTRFGDEFILKITNV